MDEAGHGRRVCRRCLSHQLLSSAEAGKCVIVPLSTFSLSFSFFENTEHLFRAFGIAGRFT
jgi:hypothetical protein